MYLTELNIYKSTSVLNVIVVRMLVIVQSSHNYSMCLWLFVCTLILPFCERIGESNSNSVYSVTMALKLHSSYGGCSF